nr:TniB family NTP-binding protein [Paraburkholderia nemoris]
MQISMVLVGTRDAVLALQTDTQMISRYTPLRFPAGEKARACGGCLQHLNECCRCANPQTSRDARSFSLS